MWQKVFSRISRQDIFLSSKIMRVDRFNLFFMRNKKTLDAVMEQIGLTLAQLRLAKGYDSIKEFTTEFGLPMIQYWRIEKGKANVTLKSLYKLLAIHSLTLQQFFCHMDQNS
jgi:hypothetical protein